MAVPLLRSSPCETNQELCVKRERGRSWRANFKTQLVNSDKAILRTRAFWKRTYLIESRSNFYCRIFREKQTPRVFTSNANYVCFCRSCRRHTLLRINNSALIIIFMYGKNIFKKYYLVQVT